MTRGKWSDTAFPKEGWTYATPKDLGEYGNSICEICESEKIRYAHLVVHPMFPDGFWADSECAIRLCPEQISAVRASDAKMRFDAEQERKRSVTVEGGGFLAAPPEVLLPRFSPVLKAGCYARFSILPFPKPRRVRFTTKGWAWVLDERGENSCWLFPVAAYPTDPGTGEAWGGRHPCTFAAVLLRSADCEAIRRLSSDKPSHYTIRWHKRYKPSPCVIWSEVGAASWRQSGAFLRIRAQQFTNPDGRWDLSNVLLSPVEEEATSADLTGIEPWI